MSSQPAPSSQDSSQWTDLRMRVLSGLAMAALGGAALWLGGGWFGALIITLGAAMLWELRSMARARHLPFAPLALYALAILATCAGLIALRSEGIAGIAWLVLIVVASDVAGYFIGRALGATRLGARFWPALSPKKTWAGVLAGWVAALGVSALFYAGGLGGAGLFALAVPLSFAGQLGDIAESALKRRAGVKDSSSLLPGHGGVLDRFDALIGATLALGALWLLGGAHLLFGGG